jgi:dienelactone hydrolase
VADDDLRDFERTSFTHDGRTHTVFRRGDGPAVIVITEMPGISPLVLDFARRVTDIGCTAVVPDLFGRAGYDWYGHGPWRARTYLLSSVVQVCVSREFVVLATGRSSPVVDWLRALAAQEHERCGGPGVGAVGMCFTGGFALAMAVDDRVLAPVVAQPGLPIGLTKKRRRTIDISPGDLDIVKRRCANDGLKVIGLRFKGDKFVPPERFAFLKEQLGPAFVAIELDDKYANPDSPVKPHSPLTHHLIDMPGEPTRNALEQVLDLFRSRLLTAR